MDEAPSEPHTTSGAVSTRDTRSDAEDPAELASQRLRELLEALRPIKARLPLSPEVFDVAVNEVGVPQLRLGMSFFVEMTPDGRVYRLQHGAQDDSAVLAESWSLEGAIDSATAAMARRVVEGERRLTSGSIPFRPTIAAGDNAILSPSVKRRQRRSPLSARSLYWIGQLFWFVVEVLGLLVLFGLGWIGLKACAALLSS